MALDNPKEPFVPRENPKETPKIEELLKSYNEFGENKYGELSEAVIKRLERIVDERLGDLAELLIKKHEEQFKEYARREGMERARERTELLEKYDILFREFAERGAERTQERSETTKTSRVADLPLFKAQTAEFERGRSYVHKACKELAIAVEAMRRTGGSPELHVLYDNLLAAMTTSRAAFDSVVVPQLTSDPQSVNIFYIFTSTNDAAAATESAIEDVIDAQDDQSAKTWIEKLGEIVRKWLGKARDALWQVIKGLLTVKEWAIKGALGGAVTWLGPTAELEIKFGR